MGCASSTPLVESGKHFIEQAKESAGDTVHKGEQALQDAGEAVKDGLEQVQDSVQEALHGASAKMGSMMGKVGENLSATSTKDSLTTEIEIAKEEINNLSDNTTEAISDAETVIMTELDNAKETVEEVQDKAEEMVEEVTEGPLEVEDVEQQADGLGESVDKVEVKAEEVLDNGSPDKESKQEEGTIFIDSTTTDVLGGGCGRDFAQENDRNDKLPSRNG